jgi:hypothetical protein
MMIKTQPFYLRTNYKHGYNITLNQNIPMERNQRVIRQTKPWCNGFEVEKDQAPSGEEKNTFHVHDCNNYLVEICHRNGDQELFQEEREHRGGPTAMAYRNTWYYHPMSATQVISLTCSLS